MVALSNVMGNRIRSPPDSEGSYPFAIRVSALTAAFVFAARMFMESEYTLPVLSCVAIALSLGLNAWRLRKGAEE